MNQGARADEDWPEAAVAVEASVAEPAPVPPFDEMPPAGRGRRLLRVALGTIALAWVGGLAWGIASAGAAGGLTALRLAAWIGLGSGPLALLALVYLIVGRDASRGYARASATLRADADALVATMAALAGRVEAARVALAAQSDQFAALDAGTSGRAAVVAGELRGQIEAIAAAATTLDDATSVARADLGVLLADLPEAERVARVLAERLREGSSEADARARTLAQLLADLDGHARSAGEATGGAAARLAGQLDRIEASAAAADKRIGDAALGIARAFDAAMEAAAEGVEETRRAVAGQSAALAAMVQQGQKSLHAVGEEAVAALAADLEALGARIAGVGEVVRGQERQTRGLVDGLGQALDAVEARFARLGDTGAEQTADLAEAIVALTSHLEAIGRNLGQSNQQLDGLVVRAAQLRAHAEASSTTIAETIPAAIGRVRLHAEHGLQAIHTAHERSEGLEARAREVAEQLAESGASLERQRTVLAEAGMLGHEKLAGLAEQAAALSQLIDDVDSRAREFGESATPTLIEALLRVRDTATQASDHAREALTSVIPRVSQRLSESAARALRDALGEVGREELDAVGEVAAQAVDAARAAAERLSRQLLTIAETSTAIDARIAENRAETEAHDEDHFARAIGLLIEALHSTSIDVARLLGTEVSDEDWKTYLRGDRGVFTRRALRLVERSEAAAIAERHSDDPAFAELVNRYIHDFEALLRRIMAARDGMTMATTMLSSDAGKLYVAVAQAIERLRR